MNWFKRAVAPMVLGLSAALLVSAPSMARDVNALLMKSLGQSDNINPIVAETFKLVGQDLTPDQRELALKCWKDSVCETGHGTLTVALAVLLTVCGGLAVVLVVSGPGLVAGHHRIGLSLGFMGGAGSAILTVIAPAAASTPAPAAATAILLIVGAGFVAVLLADIVTGVIGAHVGFVLGNRLGLSVGIFGVESDVFLVDHRRQRFGARGNRLGILDRMHLIAAGDLERHLVDEILIGVNDDGDLEAIFQRAQMPALVVERVERDFGPGAHHEIVGRALHQDLFKPAQQLQRHRGHRAHMTGAAALRAGLGRTLQDACADALAGHFEQAEMRDAAYLDACPVLPQAIGQLALHRTVVALLVHVDEIDDDQACEVAQAELAGDFLGRLQIRLQRGVLDMVFAGGPPELTSIDTSASVWLITM